MEWFMKRRKSGLETIEKAHVIEAYSVIKFRSIEKALEKKPYDILTNVCESGVNCLLNAGITLALNLIIGASAAHFSAPQIGVGADDDPAAAATQTALNDGSAEWAAMEGGFPAVSGSVVTFQGQFTDGQAQFHWLECAVKQATGATTLLNRVCADKGTKAAGEVWSAKLAITLT
jgi:hypothetical protein